MDTTVSLKKVLDKLKPKPENFVDRFYSHHSLKPQDKV